jgi:hypothetical protein
MTTPNPTPTTDRVTPPWQDTLPDVTRVDLLLAQMTLEEKVAQLGSRWVGNDMQEAGADDAPVNVAPMQDVFAASGAPPLEEASRHGLGHLTRVYGSAPLTAAEGAAELVRQQRVVLGASRLGIPTPPRARRATTRRCRWARAN